MVRNRINKLLRLKKSNRRDLLTWLRARNPRISRQNLYGWVNNHNQPREKIKRLIAEYFELNKDDIFYIQN